MKVDNRKMKFENKDASLQKRKKQDTKRKPEKIKRHEMFNPQSVPKDARSILEKFDDIVAETRGLNAKQRVFLSSSTTKILRMLLLLAFPLLYYTCRGKRKQ